MIKMHSRIAAAFLVMAMLFAMVPANVFAASDSASQTGDTTAQVSNDELEISGTNSFGELVASTIEDYNNGEYSDDAATREYSVTDIEMNGTTATVEYGALRDCTLVVAVYDEDGVKMLGSGKTDVTADAQLAEVEVSISEMPQYYLVKAFLLNFATNAPLSKVYTCELYTQAIQNIKNATMDDFADREILNLDDSTETNFAVYGEDVNVIQQSGSKNVYDSAASDPSSGKYVFTNASSEFTSLKAGDVFSHENGTEVTIVKVASVSVEQNADGTYTVTVTEDKDIDMQDVFDYVKIENNGKIESYEIDDSIADECVKPADGITTSATEIGGYFDLVDISKKIEKETPDTDMIFNRKGSVSFNINYKIYTHIYFYLSLTNFYSEEGIGLSASIEGSASDEISFDPIDLPAVHISPVFGVNISLTPTIEFKISLKASFNLSLNFYAGSKCSTIEGLVDTSTKPTIDINGSIEGTLFIGINLKPAISIINNNVAELSMSGHAGFEIKGTLETFVASTDTTYEDEKHTCHMCVDGDVNIVYEITAKAKFLNKPKWTYESILVPRFTFKLLDWYYTFDKGGTELDGELGLGICPYRTYKVTLEVKNSKGNPIEQANIYIDENLNELLGTTDSSGKCIIYLSKGSYNLTIQKEDSKVTKSFSVDSRATDVKVELNVVSYEEFDLGKCGDNLTWSFGNDSILGNNVLRISGTGDMYNVDIYESPWNYYTAVIQKIIIDSGVTSIGDYAFYSCEQVSDVSIPNTVKSVGNYAFSNCGFEEISIPDSVISIGENAFSYCFNLSKISIPNSVSSIADYTFYYCDSMKSISISDSVKSIGSYAFSGCDNLTKIIFGNSIISIGGNAFSGCYSLKDLTLPSSLNTIYAGAFKNCSSLKSITIPNTLMMIYAFAFYYCSELSDVYYTGTKDDWNEMVISDGNSYLTNATIHYNYTGNIIAAEVSDESNAKVSNSDIATSTTAASSGNASGLTAQATASVAVETATFTDLVPGTDYVMVAVKSDRIDNIFAADNLLYIDQKTAGDSGTLTFAYELREEYEGAVIKIFGTARTSIADAVVTASKLAYTGEMQSPSVTVTLNGEKLVKDADYTLSGTTEAANAGTYTFTVIGIGDYKGTVEGEFEITATEIKTNISEITMLKGTTFATQVWRYPAASTDAITYTSSDDNIATVDESGVITAVAKGKATITATAESGNSAQIKVTTVDSLRRTTTSIVIKKSAVTLTIKRNKLNPTVGLSASIKGDSTGKLWYSDNINVATVDKRGKVTAVSEGTANIYCRTADGSTSAPCVVTVNAFRIDSDNMRNNIIYVNAGDTCSVNLNNTSTSGAITWKSSNARTASIDANGNITALKKGTVTITATAPDKSKDTCKLVVVTPTEGVKLNKTSASIYTGKSVSLRASLTTRGSNEPVFWTSSNPSVATVSAKGVVKGIKQGKVTITATTFNGKKTTATITVMTKAATLEFTKVTPALYMDGNTGKFTVAITSPSKSNDTITWSTSNKKVISIERISADGKTITIKSGKKGTATITAKAGSGKKVTYKVTSVNQPAESITLNKTSADIYVGKTVSLKASKILPRGCNDVVIWESENPEIATVTPDGKVTGISQGTVTICANSFGGVQNSVTITVRTKATAVNAAAESDTIAIGESTTVSVTSISPENCNDTIKWTTSSKSVASVELNPDGKSVTVTGLKKGTVTITAKTGSGKSKKVKIVVTQ